MIVNKRFLSMILEAEILNKILTNWLCLLSICFQCNAWSLIEKMRNKRYKLEERHQITTICRWHYFILKRPRQITPYYFISASIFTNAAEQKIQHTKFIGHYPLLHCTNLVLCGFWIQKFNQNSATLWISPIRDHLIFEPWNSG